METPTTRPLLDLLKSTPVVLTLASVAAYFASAIYLSGYLYVFESSLAWFEPSIAKMLWFSWPGLAAGAVLAVVTLKTLPVFLTKCELVPADWLLGAAALASFATLQVVEAAQRSWLDAGGQLVASAALIGFVCWILRGVRAMTWTKTEHGRPIPWRDGATGFRLILGLALLAIAGVTIFTCGRLHGSWAKASYFEKLGTLDGSQPASMIFTDGSNALMFAPLQAPLDGDTGLELHIAASADVLRFQVAE